MEATHWKHYQTRKKVDPSVLEELERIAHIGSWEWQVGADQIEWSDELFRIYGVDPSVFDCTFESYLACIHPDDRQEVAATIGNALENGETFEFAHRIIRPDHEVRTLHSTGRVQRDADGRPVRMHGSCHDITQITRATAAAQEATRGLQMILDAVAEGIYGIDLEGKTTFVNRSAAHMLGWSQHELIGIQQHQTVHHSYDDGTPYPLERCPIHRTLRESTTEHITNEVFWRKDGTALEVAYTTTPVRDEGGTTGAVVTFRDVSEQRRTEGEARRALMDLVREQAARAEAESMRAQMSRMFQEAPALVALTYGPDHVFELANPKYLEVVGYRDLIGKPLREAMPEVVEQGFLEMLDEVYKHGKPYIGNEVRALVERLGTTEERYFNFVYQPLAGPNGNVYGILTHAVEVTDQVRSRQELERTNRELDQFAYIASHDLKAPLRGVSNIASWLEEDLGENLTDEVREFTQLLRSRVHRMEDLINALLTYSRAGRMRGEPSTIELDAAVREIVDAIDPPEHLEITIETKLPRVYADPISMQQVFQNLISNAITYATAKIRVGHQETPAAYRFYVADDGPGIDPRYHEKVWGMFQRLHAAGEGEGTGVGLAIVRKVADANLGRAWVESSLGEGATFWVEWPKQRHEDLPGGNA